MERTRLDGVERIVVLRANALGDLVFCLPALDSLRAAYPDAEITLLGAQWHRRFLTGRPGPVDRVELVPALPGVREPGPGEAAGDLAAWARGRAGPRPELAIQMHGGGRNSNPVVRALGARLTAGLRAEDAPPLDRWVRYVYYHPAVPVLDALDIGGLAALFSRCVLVIANDTGPLHLAAAVGAATIGLYWIGNMINGSPVYRARHRPMISWTLACPVCGADCTRDLYPARDGSGCAHRVSFVADIPAAEVIEAALDLLAPA